MFGLSPPKFLVSVQINKSTDLSKLIPILMQFGRSLLLSIEVSASEVGINVRQSKFIIIKTF